MKAAIRAVAVIVISVCAGIAMAYLLDRGLRIKSKPVVLFTPFVAAVATGVALLRIGSRKDLRDGKVPRLLPFREAPLPFHRPTIVEKRRTIINDSDRLMLVWTEPLAEDYWLRPGESLEVVANARSEACEFELESVSDGIIVFATPGMEPFFDVFQDGVKLECGHQRREGWG